MNVHERRLTSFAKRTSQDKYRLMDKRPLFYTFRTPHQQLIQETISDSRSLQ